MSKEKNEPFSDPRWNDLGKPKIIGYNETSEQEQEQNKAKFREHLKKIGVIKDK